MKPRSLIPVLALLASCQTTPPVIIRYAPLETPGAATQTTSTKASQASTVAPPPQLDYQDPVEAADPVLPEGASSEDLVQNNVEKVTVGPTSKSFDGGPVNYPFVEGRMYKIYVAPGQQTNIVLEPGEQIMGQPVTGDNSSFVLTNLVSRIKGQPVVNLFLMAKTSGKTTNMTVLTDRRTYRFVLKSYKQTYMPVVMFDYSYDALVSFSGKPQNGGGGAGTSGAGDDIFLFGRVQDFDFNYKVIPRTINKPAWAPTQVFTDGQKTYLQFASAKGAAYAPIFIALDNNGKPVIVNYRVRGIFYIIDQVIERAQLVLNKNDGNIIDIVRSH